MNQKVLLILADGLRPDALTSCGHPYADELLKLGSYSLHTRTVFPSVTLPCHMSLFHSVAPDRHGTTTNTFTPQVRPINGLCEQLKAAGKSCAFFYDWGELRDLCHPSSLSYSLFLSDRQYTYKEADKVLTENALNLMKKDAPDFVFLYLGYTDCAGHNFGWMSEQYMDAVRQSLEETKIMVDSFRDTYTIIFTADHGGHDRTHGSLDDTDMYIPLVCIGPDFTPGPMDKETSILDIAPTVAQLTNIYADTDWEGKSLLC